MAKSILIVDDSRSMRELLAFTLKSQQYVVSEAADGEQAFKKICAERFDLVITDLNMDVMDGFTLIKKVRELAIFARLPILLLTTDTTPQTKEHARAIGATGWLSKPFEAAKLLQTVARVVP